MFDEKETVTIVGGGLAGSECALQLAACGISVRLIEMRPKTMTPAHKTKNFAELVCSNSFGSVALHAASGQLKWEAEKLNSQILMAAFEARVPAGQALGMDREIFSEILSKKIADEPLIEVVNEVVSHLDQLKRPAVIATGPLTHEALAQSMGEHFGENFLYFYDAIAPIIDADSINYDICLASRSLGSRHWRLSQLPPRKR